MEFIIYLYFTILMQVPFHFGVEVSLYTKQLSESAQIPLVL